MKTSEANSGKQVGDPVRGCEAIIAAVEAEHHQMRLLLGKPAFTMANDKVEKLKENFAAWKDLTLSADFPEAELQK